MPLVGPWTDSTGTGYTYPAAYVVAHERIDTVKQTVLIDVTIWASSGLVNRRPLWQRTVAPNSSQIDNIVSFIEGRGDLALLSRPAFSGMSTTA